METGHNISELAKESKQGEKKSLVPPIPLVVLAPLLVIAALVAVAVPTSIVLNNASRDTASYLAGRYLTSLLGHVKAQAEAPVQKLAPLVDGLMRMPAVSQTFHGTFENVASSPAVAPILSFGEAYSLSSLACYTGRWKAGYNSSSALVNANFAWLSSVDHVVIQYAVAPTGIALLGVTEPTIGVGVSPAGYAYMNQSGYLYNPYTYKVLDPNRTSSLLSVSYPIQGEMPVGVLMMLDKLPAVNVTTFAIASFANGWKVGYTSRVHFPYGSKIPDYSCAAGLRIDDQWNDLLRNLKPVPNSVVAIYGQDFSIMASSNMVVAGGTEADGAVYAQAVPDSFTIAVQEILRSRYNANGQSAMKAAGTGLSIQVIIEGQKWIINLALIKMGALEDGQFLLVAALPHKEIYGVIDSATKRSLAMAIGIAVGMAVLIAGVFVMMTLPLLRLAGQMGQLTKLDFGTLEQSGALDRRSLIWELRKVQTTFATMVRAFAGAIKKNKQMAQSAASQQGRTSSVAPIMEK
ncbi:hypothetical protein DFJ77DRAFT_478086 [Powellomyces hirtus]|nr:hypothetical protein DFJ77DRAFT_478086 [Powellomyces hirtus]